IPWTPEVEIPQVVQRSLELLVPIGLVPTPRTRVARVGATGRDALWRWQVSNCGHPFGGIGSIRPRTEHGCVLRDHMLGPALYDRCPSGAIPKPGKEAIVSIKVRGKGNQEREIVLEKRGVQALKNYLAVRPECLSDVLFLNYKGEPISERGIRKLVVKYRKNAGITKRASCHTLRHTFATYKAERGVSPFQLQQWLGHANLNTTQIYVHLGKQNAKKLMEQTSLA